MTRRRIAIAGIAAAAFVLAGCSPASPTAPSSPDPTSVGGEVGEVLASGAFPDGGSVHGRVEILLGDSGSWIVRYQGLTLGDALTDDPWLLSYGPIGSDGCPAQTTWRVNLGTDASRDGGDIVVPGAFLHDPGFDDPTYIDSLGIRLPGTACGSLRFAVASLEWKVPPLHPGLEGQDSGRREGAQGTTADDVYTIADGDTAAGIEARFGLSAGQLDYLNPISQRPAPNPWAQFPKPGCTINIGFDARWRFIRCET